MTLRLLAVLFAIAAVACDRGSPAAPETGRAPASQAPVSNRPPLDPDNIVSIASRSPDHTTLVAAIEAADYVTSVAASGPFTVFAPTNDAFAKLPPGTLDGLLEPDSADDLRRLLQYHVTTSALATSSLRDGQTLGMANGAKTTIGRDGDTVTINGARVLASIPASNGIVHVIDQVLLPPGS